MTTHQKVSTINLVIKFGIKDFQFNLLLPYFLLLSTPTDTILCSLCPSLASQSLDFISTSHGLQRTSPSSQIVPHSLQIAIWTLVHREGGFILVATGDRLENTEGDERDNSSNENKEDNNKGNEGMFSG